MRIHTPLTYIFAALMLSGCVPLIIGAGATTGYFAVQERGLQQSAEDVALKLSLHERIGRLSDKYFKDISISTLEGDVLLTGVVKHRDEITAIETAAAQVKGVGNIFNELQLKPYTIEDFGNDKAIAANLRTRLTFTGNVFTINYDLHVVKGHVYIIGLAQDNTEVETLLHKASTTKGVQQVHNYIRISDSPKLKTLDVQPPKKANGGADDGGYGIKETF